MKVRLTEIFTSIEGEGIFCGTKTLFVRLAGCPYGCFYCDTLDSLPLDSGTEYEIDEACDMISRELQPSTYKVNFTGGDPLIQHEAVAEMAKFVQSKNVPTYLESSCFEVQRFSHVLSFIDIVKIEFKTVESGFVSPEQHPKLFEQALECLEGSILAEKKTYIKIVVSSKTNFVDFEIMLEKIFSNSAATKILGLIIQPTHGIAEPKLPLLMQMYDAAAKYHVTVRVVPQMHKAIGAP
ncbi:MAG: organic radical-activating protein [Cenarchaeum symbiont of Oopsacas minuta]|nr:organic radical-activating protein [Cenarchaeum symbiont of Oopsacas minuta]